MSKIEDYLETPIDVKITKFLKRNNPNFNLNIPPIYTITPEINCEYQNEALTVSQRRGIPRLYLEFIC